MCWWPYCPHHHVLILFAPYEAQIRYQIADKFSTVASVMMNIHRAIHSADLMRSQGCTSMFRFYRKSLSSGPAVKPARTSQHTAPLKFHCE